jgi:hypothetical protein
MLLIFILQILSDVTKLTNTHAIVTLMIGGIPVTMGRFRGIPLIPGNTQLFWYFYVNMYVYIYIYI